MRFIFSVFLCCAISFNVFAADITEARFALPTEQYDHCVLGDCIEYGAVEAVMDDGKILSFRLEDGFVFEDTTARLVPFGLNGKNAILAVRTDIEKGAGLVLLEARGGRLKITAESDPIGVKYRWQNPIGVGDFDHDGKMEIASVHTPHLRGLLTLYERQGKKLVIDQQLTSFSNHASGSPELDLHEIMDWNGDNTPDIILPNISRTTMQVVTFKSGKGEVIAEKNVRALINGPVQSEDNTLTFMLSNNVEEKWIKQP